MKTAELDSSPEIASNQSPSSKLTVVEYLTPFDIICFTSIHVGYKRKKRK